MKMKFKKYFNQLIITNKIIFYAKYIEINYISIYNSLLARGEFVLLKF